jgi:hypothetical protein
MTHEDAALKTMCDDYDVLSGHDFSHAANAAKSVRL